MAIKTFPLLIIGTAKGATASAAQYFGLLHETLPRDLEIERGICTGLADVNPETGIWHSTTDGRVIGKFTVTVALMRHFDAHVRALYANRYYLQNWYRYGVGARGLITRNPSRAAIQTFLIRRNKRISEAANCTLWADLDIPLRLK